MQHQITINFPSAAHKQTFCEWMSDGGGEWSYMEALDHQGYAKVIIGYHGQEDEQYPRNDKRRYGQFMCDDTIRVTLCDDSENVMDEGRRTQTIELTATQL